MALSIVQHLRMQAVSTTCTPWPAVRRRYTTGQVLFFLSKLPSGCGTAPGLRRPRHQRGGLRERSQAPSGASGPQGRLRECPGRLWAPPLPQPAPYGTDALAHARLVPEMGDPCGPAAVRPKRPRGPLRGLHVLPRLGRPWQMRHARLGPPLPRGGPGARLRGAPALAAAGALLTMWAMAREVAITPSAP
jgi:hypothetical protein